jgi:hypothetical protein
MFLIVLALSMIAPPERWVHVGLGPGGYEEYLDLESVQRSGTKVTLWTRRDFASGRGTVWNELEFDCSARTGAILAYVRDDNGTVTHNVARPHREAAPIAPASVEETLFKLACR